MLALERLGAQMRLDVLIERALVAHGLVANVANELLRGVLLVSLVYLSMTLE